MADLISSKWVDVGSRANPAACQVLRSMGRSFCLVRMNEEERIVGPTRNVARRLRGSMQEAHRRILSWEGLVEPGGCAGML